ncbi:GTA-gp10 family protein [Sphingorhabdus arenilitoris]|uniref:GTA-gp10 family protein n=1 Tax=Sphingorhabdus arenilitoris TaxID=1490041 RepID=A0ABV8RE19_9SPHN
MTVNAMRGEAQVAGYKLRPSFTALVAAEEELGPLFALVERAAAGQLKLSEMTALFWHCAQGHTGINRAEFSDAVAEAGLAAATPALKILLGQILNGQ